MIQRQTGRVLCRSIQSNCHCHPGKYIRYLHNTTPVTIHNKSCLLNEKDKPTPQNPSEKINELQDQLPSSITGDGEDTESTHDNLFASVEDVERFIKSIRPRTAHLSLPYFSDLSVMDPVMDYPQPEAQTAGEEIEEMWDPEEEQREALENFDRREDELNEQKGIIENYDTRTNDERTSRDNEEVAFTESEENLMAERTGLTREQLNNLLQYPVVVHRVANQTKMGKIKSMYALVVAGNGDGLVGYGEGKDSSAGRAIRKAFLQAAKNLDSIPRFEQRTFYGDMRTKFHAIELAVRARPPGFGLRVNHLIYEICRCAGIKDLSAKLYRSKNPMNVVKAFFKAMKSQKLPETIAKERGKNIYDVKKSYYGH